jgi:RNA polymerase sigma-70 factor (ECF subfamily)
LVRIVVNESLGRLRRDKRAQIIPLTTTIDALEHDDQDSLIDYSTQQPENAAMRTELRTVVEARIDLLPDIFRTVFVMRAVEDMSVEEVSLALDIPEATVRTRYFRARSLLRESLAKDIDITLEDAFSFDGARCDRIVANVLARTIL